MRKTKFFLPVTMLSMLLSISLAACGGSKEESSSSVLESVPPSSSVISSEESSAPSSEVQSSEVTSSESQVASTSEAPASSSEVEVSSSAEESSSPSSSSSAKLEKMTITAADGKKNLILGDTVQLTASAGEVVLEGVTWTSADEAIATVSDTGLVTSIAVGSVKITASKEGYKDANITIKVDLETITVSAADNKNTLIIGETVQLAASVGEAALEGITWTTSDEAIATVSDTGLVTAVAKGSATITASKDGFNAGKITITVNRPAPTAILDLQYADHYAFDGEWSSSGRGPIDTPVYEKSNARDGICLAYFGDGDKETLTFTSDVAVKAELVLMIGYYYSIDDASQSFTAKFNDADLTIPANQPYESEGTSDYTYKGLSLGMVDIAIGNNVLELTMKEGAQYHPYLDDIEVYAESAAVLTVVPAAEKDPVVVNEESLTIAEGKTAQITSTMTDLTFKSNDTAVATVSDEGLVTGVKVGATTINVSKDGYKTIRVPVTVTEAEGVIAISINQITGEGIATRTSRNLEEPYNYIIDEDNGGFPTNAVGTIKFNAAADGTYEMYMRCRASGGYNSTTTDDLATCMTIKVNNVVVAASGTVSGNSFTDYLLGEVNLTAGENTIEITCLTTVPTINMFRFLPKA